MYRAWGIRSHYMHLFRLWRAKQVWDKEHYNGDYFEWVLCQYWGKEKIQVTRIFSYQSETYKSFGLTLIGGINSIHSTSHTLKTGWQGRLGLNVKGVWGGGSIWADHNAIAIVTTCCWWQLRVPCKQWPTLIVCLLTFLETDVQQPCSGIVWYCLK